MRTLFCIIFVCGLFASAQPSRIELRSLQSSTLGTLKEFNILFPEGYDSESDRYPVLYLFRGAVDEWADPTEDGSRRGNIKTVMDSLYSAKKIGKMICIMPGLGAPAQAAEYNYLINDLIPYVDEHFRTIPDRWHRSMDGFSLGGLITTNLLSSVPHLFGSVGSYDGTLSLFDNARFTGASPALVHLLKQTQLLYHTGSLGPSNASNNAATFTILNSRGIFNALPSFTLHPSAQHNWYFADLHIAVTAPLHWNVSRNAANSLSLSFIDSLSGKVLSGEQIIRWSRINTSKTPTVFLSYSDDGGIRWKEFYSTDGNDTSAVWNTALVKDGTRYRLKALGAVDSLFGESLSGTFTVNNPGNGAPDIAFTGLNERDTLSEIYDLQWYAGDADGNAISISIDISFNSGVTWNSIASSLPNNGTVQIDTRSFANSTNVRFRLLCSDGMLTSSAVSPQCIIRNKRIPLPSAQVRHLSGFSDALISVAGVTGSPLSIADYTIQFKDSAGSKSYTVYYSKGAPVVTSSEVFDGKSEGQSFNGYRLTVKDFPVPAVNKDSSRWISGASQLNGLVNLTDIFLEGQTITAVPYASDYEIRITQTPSDTSLSLYGVIGQPVPFYVWNRTLGKKTKFIFVELDGNGKLSRNDELYLFEYSPQSGFSLTWHFSLNGIETASDPLPGDIFFINVMKPLTSEDSYSFQWTPTNVPGEPVSVPAGYHLYRNYPNPFNPSTTITFSIPRDEIVTITVFNVLGRNVKTVVSSKMTAGTYALPVDFGNLSSGVYFCQMETPSFRQTQKMLLIK